MSGVPYSVPILKLATKHFHQYPIIEKTLRTNAVAYFGTEKEESVVTLTPNRLKKLFIGTDNH